MEKSYPKKIVNFKIKISQQWSWLSHIRCMISVWQREYRYELVTLQCGLNGTMMSSPIHYEIEFLVKCDDIVCDIMICNIVEDHWITCVYVLYLFVNELLFYQLVQFYETSTNTHILLKGMSSGNDWLTHTSNHLKCYSKRVEMIWYAL